jgi:hypothetical protein
MRAFGVFRRHDCRPACPVIADEAVQMNHADSRGKLWLPVHHPVQIKGIEDQ